MSIEASSFVLSLSMGRGNGIRKLILLGYANHACCASIWLDIPVGWKVYGDGHDESIDW